MGTDACIISDTAAYNEIPGKVRCFGLSNIKIDEFFWFQNYMDARGNIGRKTKTSGKIIAGTCGNIAKCNVGKVRLHQPVNDFI